MNQIISLRRARQWEEYRKWLKDNHFTVAAENMTDIKLEHDRPDLLLRLCQDNVWCQSVLRAAEKGRRAAGE